MHTENSQDTAILLAKRESWVDYTESAILHFDALMFPEETHIIFSQADIRGHITYQDEHEVYLFNSHDYVCDIEAMMHRRHIPPEKEFDEVQCLAAIIAAYAARLRAWEILKPPRRGLSETLRDDRIPWNVRKMLRCDPKIRGSRQSTKDDPRPHAMGRLFADDLDLTILATLASFGYRHQMSPEWLRPFVLT